MNTPEFKNIYITGFMGSGKTTFGKRVAKHLNLKFYDLDYYIEDELNSTCFDLIEKFGVEYFRKIENQKLAFIATLDDCVVSLGGGTLIAEQNQKQVLTKGLLVYLRWTPEGLLDNLKKSTTRPLLKNIEKDSLMRLFFERSEGYAQAHIVIDCDGKTKKQITEDIVNECSKYI